ncbi:MAG: integrase arm-type DNA-binding domain-containing protein [Pseudomonadota bacterium]
MGKLTARGVETAGSGRHGDGEGLWLHVGKTGGRSWVLRYKRNGKQREMGLGPTSLVTLAEAREDAREARRKLFRGIDPLDEREAQKAKAAIETAKRVTFGQAAEQCIKALSAGWKNEKHAAQWPSTLNSYAMPVFGHLPVAEIDTGLVMKVLEPIWLEKPETASRLRGRIEAVLNWAQARGYRSGENPARWKGHLDHLLPAREKVRAVKHHAAVPWRELPEVYQRIGKVSGAGAKALMFATLTAARSGEVRGATWSEIDLERRTWTVPAGRMKAGREHRVPLSDAAVGLLNDMQPLAQGADSFVFPGNRPGKPLSDMTLTATLRRLEIEATPHGMRSAFADWAAEATHYQHEVREMALAHTISSAVERAYRRGDLFDRRRALMDDWARFLTTEKAENVVELREGVA